MLFDDKLVSVEEAKNYNPQVLAFVGDAVHTLYVRTFVATQMHAKPNDVHKVATEYIKASGQSEMVEKMLPMLNDVEHDVFRRARNYKTNNIAKNAKVIDYKRATGFEAVIGFLYITGQHDRIKQILQTVTTLEVKHED